MYNKIIIDSSYNGVNGKIFESADDAYAAARKDLGLEPGEKTIDIIHEYYNNGKGYWTDQNVEVYSGNRAILNHSAGHFYSDGMMQSHYNVGIWSFSEEELISTGFHYFY